MGEFLYGRARYIRQKAEVDGERIKQKASNERAAAESSLATWSRSLSNRRILDAMGGQVNDLTENLGRNLDAATFGKAMSRIQAAEELGASAAAAAAAGVGGSSIETYNRTIETMTAFQEQQDQRAVDSAITASARQRGNLLIDGVASLDGTVTAANMDFRQFVDPAKPQSGLGKLFTIGAAAAATFLGGPQAGMAVLQFNEANQAARNGDFGRASAELSNGLTSAIGGFDMFRSGAGQGQFGSAWGRDLFKKRTSGVTLKG